MSEKKTKNEEVAEKKPRAKAPEKSSAKASVKKEKVKKKPEDYVASDYLDFLGKKCEVIKNIQSQKLIRVKDLEDGSISLVGYTQI